MERDSLSVGQPSHLVVSTEGQKIGISATPEKLCFLGFVEKLVLWHAVVHALEDVPLGVVELDQIDSFWDGLLAFEDFILAEKIVLDKPVPPDGTTSLMKLHIDRQRRLALVLLLPLPASFHFYF